MTPRRKPRTCQGLRRDELLASCMYAREAQERDGRFTIPHNSLSINQDKVHQK